MNVVSSTATITTGQPALASRRTLNSSPRENISRITPSSDSVCTVAESATNGIGTCGPTTRPASMYPNTNGRRRRWNTSVDTAATPRTRASVRRKSGAACMAWGRPPFSGAKRAGVRARR